MASIHLTTFIAAPVERVFNLSRHLALYKFVFQSRKERFSSGAGGGLLTKGETISVLARRLGKTRMFMLKITNIQVPVAFTEEQVKGDLKYYRHEHHFRAVENGTILIDLLDFGAPRDLLGRLVGRTYFRNYFEQLAKKRLDVIRSYAETEKWRALLS